MVLLSVAIGLVCPDYLKKYLILYKYFKCDGLPWKVFVMLLVVFEMSSCYWGEGWTKTWEDTTFVQNLTSVGSFKNFLLETRHALLTL